MTTLEFIKWIVGSGIVPFGAAFGGAYFAYRFSLKQKEKETKTRIRIRLQLIKHDVKIGQTALRNVLKLWKREKYIFFNMPITYFRDLDFVELGKYISNNCIDNIRNIYEYVFSAWNRRLEEMSGVTNRGIIISQTEDYIYENLIAPLVDTNPSNNYIEACNKVIKVIDEELGKLT